MSKIFEAITKATLEARRNRSSDVKCLVPLVADIQRVAKDKQSEVADDDCIKVLKSTIKNVGILIDNASGEAKTEAENELALLKSFMPQAPSDEEVQAYIESLDKSLNKGQIMKAIKEKFGSALDVAKIAKSLS